MPFAMDFQVIWFSISGSRLQHSPFPTRIQNLGGVVMLFLLEYRCLLSRRYPVGLCEPIWFFVLKCHIWWERCLAVSFYSAKPHSRSLLCDRSPVWYGCKHWKELCPFHHNSQGFSISTHDFSVVVHSAQSHRSLKAIANFSNGRIPRPSKHFCLQTRSPLTLHFPPEADSVPDQRKLLLSNLSRTLFVGFDERKKIDRLGCDDGFR